MKNQITVVRDFNGGLNIVDDDLNLNSSFQTMLDNVHRGIDSALSTRYGYTLFADMRDGATKTFSSIDRIIITVEDVSIFGQRVYLQISSEFYDYFEHITFVDPLPIPEAGITLQGTYGAIPTPYGSFVIMIWHEVRATASFTTGTINRTNGFIRDSHMLAGEILEVAYFNDFIVVVDNLGEIASIDRDGTKLRIWSNSNAYKQWEKLNTDPEDPDTEYIRPWSRIIYTSSDIFKAELIVCNGFDKPLSIDFTRDPHFIVQYLGDPGNNNSNANTKACRYVRSVGRWLVMAGDPENPFRVHISSTDTSGVWYGDVEPNDATFVDVTNIASSSSSIIRGINRFREFCVVGFDDACVLLELGIFDGTEHTPDPVDTIVRHGTIAHKTMVYMGFDLLMADAIGVPGLAKSLYDNTTMPSRHSDFIGPIIQRNVSRLSGFALENECFAVFNSHDNRYILFMPDYDDDQIQLARNPFVVHGETPQGRVLVHAQRHLLEPGSLVAFSGATGLVGGIDAANLNVSTNVVGVISDDWFSIDIPVTFTDIGGGGGTTVIMTRKRKEQTGYAYTYNKNLKIKSWSRYRDMQFVAGCSSVYGRLFLATKTRVWRMGTKAEPIYGDQLNGYQSHWLQNTAYTENALVVDDLENKTYKCIVAHTSALSGTFEQARATTDKEYWEAFLGYPIKFELELPWADFDKRDRLKVLKQVGIDAKGTGRFNLQMFNDYYYKSRLDGTLTPSKQMEMVGGDSGGYGGELVPYGSGRQAVRQRLWPWDMRGKLFKIRIEGNTNEHLSFVALIIAYGLGGTMR